MLCVAWANCLLTVPCATLPTPLLKGQQRQSQQQQQHHHHAQEYKQLLQQQQQQQRQIQCAQQLWLSQ